MRVTLLLDDVVVEIPNFDIHNSVLPNAGDYWESPSKEEIDYRIGRGYMSVKWKRIMGNDGKMKDVGVSPETTFKVVSRRFKQMDCREVEIIMKKGNIVRNSPALSGRTILVIAGLRLCKAHHLSL